MCMSIITFKIDGKNDFWCKKDAHDDPSP